MNSHHGSHIKLSRIHIGDSDKRRVALQGPESGRSGRTFMTPANTTTGRPVETHLEQHD